MSEKKSYTFTQQEVILILKQKKGKDSLKTFSEKLGVSRQTLWLILHGKQLPNRKVGFELVEKRPIFRLLED